MSTAHEYDMVPAYEDDRFQDQNVRRPSPTFRLTVLGFSLGAKDLAICVLILLNVWLILAQTSTPPPPSVLLSDTPRVEQFGESKVSQMQGNEYHGPSSSPNSVSSTPAAAASGAVAPAAVANPNVYDEWVDRARVGLKADNCNSFAPSGSKRHAIDGRELSDAEAELVELYSSCSYLSDDIDHLMPPPDQWPTAKARVGVVTACSGKKYEQKGSQEGKTISEHTWRNKQVYAAARGYDAIDVDLSYYKAHSRTDLTGSMRMFVWAKIPVLAGCLLRYDYCFWVDADAVITNVEITVESFFRFFADHHNGREPGMVVGETFEFFGSDDPRIPSMPMSYRLNTGTVMVKSTDWGREFMRRTWAMEGLDMRAKKDYIEGFNHEQSTMQYFLLNNPEDRRNTYNPPNQAINIHNYYCGPRDKWHVGSFILHYYGGFQGVCRSRHHTEGHSECIDEFIDHCYAAARSVKDEVRRTVYKDWDTDKEAVQRVGDPPGPPP